jgi:hypothetical protein
MTITKNKKQFARYLSDLIVSVELTELDVRATQRVEAIKTVLFPKKQNGNTGL